MPLCSYQQAPDRNDRTVVENIFLREFMPAAPEGAVKAYLYGLMQCQQGTGAGSLSAFARAVALSETEVQDAFAYWQEKGLVLVQTKPMFAELMPGLVCKTVRTFSETGLPIIAGGLVTTPEEVRDAFDAGAYAVSTSARLLW